MARGKVGRQALLGLVDSLESGTKKLHWRASGTEWADYYEDTNYTPEGLGRQAEGRRGIHRRGPAADRLGPRRKHRDLQPHRRGRGLCTVSFDIDPACVERNYLRARAGREAILLPLLWT